MPSLSDHKQRHILNLDIKTRHGLVCNLIGIDVLPIAIEVNSAHAAAQGWIPLVENVRDFPLDKR